jgi:hypothetical protein
MQRMLCCIEQTIYRSDANLQGDKQGSTRLIACLDAYAQAPSLLALASACSSLPRPRTCLSGLAQALSYLCSLA